MKPGDIVFCVALSETQREGDSGPLMANCVTSGLDGWEDVGGTIRLYHQDKSSSASWFDNWPNLSGEACHIACILSSWDKTNITLKAQALALDITGNITMMSANHPHELPYRYPELISTLTVPIIGKSTQKITNEDGLSINHNGLADDYIEWNITGETVKNCLFLKPIPTD